ncbi:uncharacterized protein LOC127253697 [Andrographis paniculata]|uniref:uncharacterized protein LOC127253697 n=1 Tax=Andrographis paniculata TaxID=175694 RepID=UPI0021E6F0BB|nr:uncharacterized protein LOC127253697 [Andrographis paniculata]
MVSTRGKKITSSSNDTVGENETAKNALTEMQTSNSPVAKLEESNSSIQVEDELEAAVEDAKNEIYEETDDKEENEKMKEVENDDENETATETNGDNLEAEETLASEDDGRHDQDVIQEDDNSEDSEEDIATAEENVSGGDEVSDGEEIEEQYLGVDGSENEDGVSEEDIGGEDAEVSNEDIGGEDDEVSNEDIGGEDDEEAKEGIGGDDDEEANEGIREDDDEEANEGIGGDDDEEANEDIGGDDDERVKVSEIEAMEEHNQANIKGKEIVKEDEKDTKEHNTVEPKASLKKIKKSSQRRKKKKQAPTEKEVIFRDKPESSSKKKAKKKIESMGMIFMCSSKTKDDCYKYRVLGLPESKKDLVVKIYSGMRLFLYDVDLKLLYGIYKAAGPGGYNIEPKAFKSQFPSQVRFTVMEDCLPLAEEKFKKVIKDNYYTKTKFNCKLTSEQVKKLCKLFIASSKGQKSTQLSRSRKEVKPPRKTKDSKQRSGDKRRLRSRGDPQSNERPRKRAREIIMPVPLLPPAPPPYAIGRASEVEAYRRGPYLESRINPLPSHRDSYRDLRYPLADYRDGRGEYLERQYLTSYPDRGLNLEPRDTYRDLYNRSGDAYRNGHDPYLERQLYPDHYKRDPLPVRPEVYRDERGLELRDPYQREEPLDRRDLRPRHHDIVGSSSGSGAGSFVPYRGRLSYPEPVYYLEREPSQSSRVRLYRL